MGIVYLGMRSFLSELAPSAESIDFQRTAQQCELSQARCTFEKPVNFRYLYVLDPSASDANDVVMRFHVAVITRGIVQRRHLPCLSQLAKLLQNPMDCGQRYVGMLAAHGRAYVFGARMVPRGEQRSYDREPLRCDGNPALMTPRDKLAESLSCIPLTPPSIHQP